MSDLIYGVHAVLEALEGGRRGVKRVVIAASRRDGRVAAIVRAARGAGVPVERMPAALVRRLAGGEAVHQGVVASVEPARYEEPETVLRGASDPALLVVLDGVDDPRNLGAVIRSAAAAGADGLFLPARRAVGLTGACLKVAAGAAERLPIARVGNVVSFLKLLKKRGIWVIGLDGGGDKGWTSFDLRLPVALVLGGEGRGLRRLARENCDVILSIPLERGVESLNLAVAAGVALFEVVRQRGGREARLS